MSDKLTNDQLLEFYRDVYRKQNEHQLAYNKTIFGLGYGGALGIWALLRSEISPTSAAIVGLAMIVSLSSYLVFEIIQMLLSMLHNHRMSDALHKSGTTDDSFAAVRVVQAKNDWWERYVLYPGWYISITVSILTSFSAAIYLATILVMKLGSQI